VVCLGKDNRFYILPDQQIRAVEFGAKAVDLLEQDAINILKGLRRPPWIAYSDVPAMYVERSTIPDKTKLYASKIPDLEDEAPPPEVVAQQHRYDKVKDTLESSPFHSLERKKAISKAFKFLKKQEEEEEEQRELDKQQDNARSSFLWNQFLNLTNILNKYGFVNGMDVSTELGVLGAGVKGDNELWVALVLLELDNLFWENGLEPHHLAAVVSAIVAYEPPPQSGEMPSPFQPSEESLKLIDHLASNVQAPLLVEQENYRVSIPVNLETYYMGLVEAWALGEDWLDLVEASSMQEGDLCNLLRRTLDVLRLCPRLPTLSKAFKRQARSATKMVGRYPITDTVTYELEAEELTNEDLAVQQDVDAENGNDKRADAMEDRPPSRAQLNATSQGKRRGQPANIVMGSFGEEENDVDEELEARLFSAAQLARSKIRSKEDMEEDEFFMDANDEFDDEEDEEENLFDIGDEDEDEDDAEFENESDTDKLIQMLASGNIENYPGKRSNANRKKSSPAREPTDVVQDLLDALGDQQEDADW